MKKIAAGDGFARGLCLATLVVRWTAPRGRVLGGGGGGVARRLVWEGDMASSPAAHITRVPRATQRHIHTGRELTVRRTTSLELP